MKVNFPRIHSLSTIGIIYHFNANYLFHPFRTDFTGEGGSGKTMIADMIQLILVGPGNYLSATEGNDKRPIDGMIVQAKQRQYGAGYLIMNIEVSPRKYLAIGCFIEKSSKQSKMFIAQAGYDWDKKLEFLSAPAYYEDFLVNDRIISIEELNKTLHHIHLKPLSTKVYHRLLYENGIINIDLSNRKKLESYANIFRSFSRGKGLKTGSENLKDFLFGDDEKTHMFNYQQQVKSISDDFHEHDRYQKEIELIRQKEGYIKEIVKLQSIYKSFEERYRTEKALFWSQQEEQTRANHDTCQLNYNRVNIERACLRLHSATLEHEELKNYSGSYTVALEKFELLKGQVVGSEEKMSKCYSQLAKIEAQLEQVKLLEFLISESGSLDALYARIESEGKFYSDRALLQKFQNYLEKERIINEFEDSVWIEDYEQAIYHYNRKHQALSKKINDLQELQVFSDIQNPNSLAAWAINFFDRPLSHEEESILIRFQKLPRTKPEIVNELSSYLPEPKILFQHPDIHDKELGNGFWLDRKGVFEYISYSPNQYLNTDKSIIYQRLSSFKNGLDQELKESQTMLTNIESLKQKLFEFEQFRYVVPLYLQKEFFQREPLKHYLIGEEQLTEMCSNRTNKEGLQAGKKLLTETIEELVRRQDQKGIDLIKEEIARGEKYFRDNNIDPSNLEKAINTKYDKRNSRQVELIELKESLHKDDLEIDYIFRTITQNITSTAASIKRELEIEVVFNKEKSLYDSIIQQLKICREKLKEAKEEYQKFFNYAFSQKKASDEHKSSIIEKDPEEEDSNSLKSKWQSAKINFEGKYELIVQELEDSTSLKGSYHVGQLAHRLLPTVFTSSKSAENNSVEALLAEKLDYLHQSIREIGSRKLEILKKVFTEVNQTYRDYLVKIKEIDNYFKDPQKRITGGSKASLVISKSTDYPANWMSVFNKTLSNELSYVGMFERLTKEIDINEMMKAAFLAEGGTKNATIEDLLNPKSYFNLEFKLKLDTGENNSGSNSQAYSGHALLGLARLSLIEDKRPGIKIMPIDEAQGLGSNYEMLREVALDEGYQILSMSIESAGELREGEQYIYILSENRLQDHEHYVPAMAIFTEGHITGDIDQFINNIENEGT